ncbi:hypothetical protein PHMEG_0007969 [Phytophthora megakarya]|uniref:Uncharacterized protein n=1 Tax=Phytophthora megakarya TaxID=4795 RepID=A0A225WMB9_9STRA|nr:hypothetical protein PHMEG_0007969 [Phytophthora megakarya]
MILAFSSDIYETTSRPITFKTTNRRFEDFKNRRLTQDTPAGETTTLKEEWDDNARVLPGYEGYRRTWDLTQADEATSLVVLLREWILLGKSQLSQAEVEKRWLAFDFGSNSCSRPTASAMPGMNTEPTKTCCYASFKEAVSGSPTSLKDVKAQRQSPEELISLQEIYDLCTAPAKPTTSLREMTPDENKAMDMIFAGDLEVPGIPTFLMNVLSKADLAAFENVFETQTEYTVNGQHRDGLAGVFLLVLLYDYTTMHDETDEHGLKQLVRLDSYALTVQVSHREIKADELLQILDTVMEVPIHSVQRVTRDMGEVTAEPGMFSSPYRRGRLHSDDAITGSGWIYNRFCSTTHSSLRLLHIATIAFSAGSQRRKQQRFLIH